MAESLPTNATSQQMSLALFEDMLSDGLAIHESPKDIGFQRNNVFIDIADLGITARRMIDAAYFVVAQEPTAPRIYDVELSYFRWLMRYDSYNYKHLRAVVTEAQKAVVQVTDTPHGSAPSEKDPWVSVHLLGTVGIANGRIAFEVPHQLVRHIKDPVNSHWLSLRITAAFTLSYARAIYDHVLPYVIDGNTDWIPLDVVRNWPGKAGASAAVFKYFRRDYLDPAVRQINELSDIELAYETRTASPSSRKIDRIRFRAARKKGAPPAMQHLQGAQEVYFTLKNEFGLTDKHFNEISEHRNTWTDDWIQQAIEFTRFKLKQGKITLSPAGFLMKALRDNLRISDAERLMVGMQEEKAAAQQVKQQERIEVKRAQEAHSVAQESAVRALLADEVKRGREAFDAADARTQKSLMNAYRASAVGKLNIRRLKLDPSEVSEVDLLAHAELAWGFFHFVHLKLKSGN